MTFLETSAQKIPFEPKILYRSKGHQHGPITRLVSPGDIGELIKPFVFLDMLSLEFNRGGLFGYHPHSGIATVTLTLEGSMEYEDSTGKAGLLHAGSVEWMQAGGGVWHTGGPVSIGGSRLRGFQLWIALPPELENAEPESLYIESHQILNSGPARVIIGEYKGVSSPLPKVAPLIYLHVNLKEEEEWVFDPPNNHDVLWIAVNEGTVEVSGELISKEIAILDYQSNSLKIKAKGNVSFVLGSAVKHPHSLITGAHSVHTTEDSLKLGEDGIRKVGKRLKAEGLI